MTTSINPKYKSGTFTSRTSDSFLQLYSSSIDLELHNKLCAKLPKPEELEIWPQFSLDKIEFLKGKGPNGEELYGETLQDLLLANAQVLARQVLKTYGPELAELASVETIYVALATKKISLASPFFNNLRKAKPSNLASCFIMEIEDSLESIMKSATHCAEISKSGGGAGVYMGLIRGKGASINGTPNAAQSINHWVKIIDSVCSAVNQQGRRPGAITAALPVWHTDLWEFFEIQTETGDLRTKSFNIQPQVVVCDAFMEAVDANGTWDLYDPSELRAAGLDPRQLVAEWLPRAKAMGLKPRSSYMAREIWAKIQKLQRTVGRPYVFFQDAVNDGSPFKKHFGTIHSGNLCQESYSYFKANEYIHTCSLISINVGVHQTLEEISATAFLGALLLDCSLELSAQTIPEVQNHIKDFRTLGIGTMGLADWLAFNETSYGDTSLIESTAKAIALGAYEASLKAAAAAGPCGAAQRLEPSKLMLDLEASPEGLALGLEAQRKRYGIRNALLLCTAPNTSTSIVMGACPSFLPPYDLNSWVEGNNDLPSTVHLRYDPQAYVMDIKALPPSFVLEAALAIQKWTDAGISCEFLFVQGKPSSENKAFSELKMEAWRRGLKAIYYVRGVSEGKRGLGSDGLGSGGECSACAN